MKKGFTLIEVVIAILVLSVSTLVVIAMQTSTLRGYSSIRDTDDAVMIAHRTADLLHINASSWRESDTDLWTFETAPSYGPDHPFPGTDNPLRDIRATPWIWIPLFDRPVDGRMTTSAVSFGRHCVYVRGGPFEGSLTVAVDAGGVITGSPAMLVQIAVVSTGIHNTITTCSTPANNSPPFALTDLEFTGGEIPLGMALELKGYRPTYHATLVFKREFL